MVSKIDSFNNFDGKDPIKKDPPKKGKKSLLQQGSAAINIAPNAQKSPASEGEIAPWLDGFKNYVKNGENAQGEKPMADAAKYAVAARNQIAQQKPDANDIDEGFGGTSDKQPLALKVVGGVALGTVLAGVGIGAAGSALASAGITMESLAAFITQLAAKAGTTINVVIDGLAEKVASKFGGKVAMEFSLLLLSACGFEFEKTENFKKDFGKTIHGDTIKEFYIENYDTIYINPNPGPDPDPDPDPEPQEDSDVFDIAARNDKIDNAAYQNDVATKHDKKIDLTFEMLGEELHMIRGIEVGDIVDVNEDMYSAKVKAGPDGSPQEKALVTIKRQSENANEFTMNITYDNDNAAPTFFDNCRWQAAGEGETRIFSNAKGLIFGDKKYNDVHEYLDDRIRAYYKKLGKDIPQKTRDVDFGGADLVLKYEKRNDGNYYPVCYVKFENGYVSDYSITQYFLNIEHQE